jgi:hypothetical protein
MGARLQLRPSSRGAEARAAQAEHGELQKQGALAAEARDDQRGEGAPEREALVAAHVHAFQLGLCEEPVSRQPWRCA